MHLHHVLVLLLVWLSFSGRRGIPALQDWQACITRDGCYSGVGSSSSQCLSTSPSWLADTSDGRAYHVSPDVRSPSSQASRTSYDGRVVDYTCIQPHGSMVRPPCGLAQTLPTSAQTEPQRTWQDARDPSDPANRATYIEQSLREAAVLGRTESADTRDLLLAWWVSGPTP